MSKFFVYVDYTTEEISRPYYVGYGQSDRVKKLTRNTHHKHVSKKYGFRRDVVLETDDLTEAKQREITLIAELHTFVGDPEYVFGTNYTIGGDGSTGHPQPPITEEHRQAIRRSNSHPKSLETRQRMKEAAQRRANDPAWREKMSEVSRERWKSDEYREKVATQTTGKKRTDEQRERFSAAQQESWSDQDKRDRASAAAKKRFDDPAEKERVSEQMCELWKDSSYREKRVKSYRKYSKRKLEPHEKARIAEKMKELWKDPNYRAKRSKVYKRKDV